MPTNTRIKNRARALFQEHDRLDRQLRKVKARLDHARRSYAVTGQSLVMRPEAFRRECGL